MSHDGFDTVKNAYTSGLEMIISEPLIPLKNTEDWKICDLCGAVLNNIERHEKYHVDKDKRIYFTFGDEK